MNFLKYRRKDVREMAVVLTAVAAVPVILAAAGAVFAKPRIETAFAEWKEERERKREWEEEMNIPYDALEYNGHYYFVYDDADSWNDAKYKCELLGGHLAAITDAGENEAVYQHVSAQKESRVFLGAYLTVKKDQEIWEWVTGEGTDYTSWADGKPESGEERECKYGTYNEPDESKWRAAGIFDTRAYVCEWECADAGRKENAPDSGEIYPGVSISYKGHHYAILEGSVTYEDALAECETYGGYLAVINNKKENKKLYKFMLKRGYSYAHFGYRYHDGEEGFFWDYGAVCDYENWAEGQPDTYYADAMFTKDQKYKWTTGEWSEVYICEWGDQEYSGITSLEDGEDDSDEEHAGEEVVSYDGDYILPDSDSRYLDRAELEYLSAEELRIARNEIYARHGRLFEDGGLSAYFNSKSWYEGYIGQADFDDGVFNDYETQNLILIRNYEQERGS